MAKKGFSTIPNSLIVKMISELSIKGKNLMLALIMFYNKQHGVCWPSNESLMKASGINSSNWLFAARAELKKLGFIDYKIVKGGAKYTIPQMGKSKHKSKNKKEPENDVFD